MPITPIYDHLIKIILVGDSGVGKSCMLSRFTDNEFSHEMMSTIGVDFKFKDIEVEEKHLRLQLWDTAGQERFRTLTANYYRGSHGIMLVFDVTSFNSFQHVSQWLQEIKAQTGATSVVYLVGNKTDLEAERVVDTTTAKSLAEKHNLVYVETSALQNNKIDDIFYSISKNILTSGELERAKAKPSTVIVQPPPTTEAVGWYCCS